MHDNLLVDIKSLHRPPTHDDESPEHSSGRSGDHLALYCSHIVFSGSDILAGSTVTEPSSEEYCQQKHAVRFKVGQSCRRR